LNAPIRLVFCITELDLGGAERALTQLVLGLDRTQWEPHVISLGPRGHFADALEAASVPVVCLNATSVSHLPGTLIRLRRELKRIRPLLVQTFLFHANILGRVAARWARVPHVVSGLRVADRRSPWYGRIDRWTNRWVDMNVCVSQGVADYAAKYEGLHTEKLIVIPNAVDLNRFAQASPASLAEFGIPADSRVLISIGRLDRQKGIDVLLNAVALIQYEKDDLHFLIVGDGPCRASLHELARQLNIVNRVHFAGRRDDVPALLAASTALVLPSRWEGMANVVLEAMASGKTVIATKVEGIEELVQPELTGLVVPIERPDELAKAIQTLVNDPQFVNEAGVKSQQIIYEHFTSDRVADAYVDLYRRILELD